MEASDDPAQRSGYPAAHEIGVLRGVLADCVAQAEPTMQAPYRGRHELQDRGDDSAGWVPGPPDVRPESVFPPYTDTRGPWMVDNEQDRADALAGALVGVELGNYDRMILAWLVGWDNSVVATVVSLIWRARLAAAHPAPGAREQ